MNYPEQFYYLDSVGTPHYTTSPTVEMDVNRLLQNKAPWIAPTSSERKPKKLIITDWRARNWTFEKQEAMIDAVKQLIDEGFTLYIWQIDRIVPLSKTSVDAALLDEEVRRNIGPVFLEEVAKKAYLQYKMPREQMLLLDDYWVDSLLKGAFLGPVARTLSYGDWSKLDSEERNKLMAFFEQHPIKEIIRDHYLKEMIFDHYPSIVDYIQQFQSISKNARITEFFQQATLDCDSLDNVLKGQLKGFSKSSLFELRKLSLEGGFYTSHMKSVSDLLKLTPRLKTLDFSRVRRDDRSPHILTVLKDAPQLQEIIGSFWGNSHQGVLDLLSYHDNLKSLKIDGLLSLNQKTIIKNRPLKLKIIALTGSKFDIDFLQALLEAAPNLTSLNARGSFISDLTGLLKINSVLKLSYLDLSKAIISYQSLDVLLKASPNLKRLKLLSGTLISLPANSLLQLEDLDLSGSNITSDQLAHLLKAAPNLKSINLSYCRQLSGTLEVSANSLIKVEKIEGVSGVYLSGLLKASPNIKSLKLKGNVSDVQASIDVFRGLDNPSFTELEDLGIYVTKVMSKDLELLLRAAPNLTKLELTDSKLVNDLTLRPASLKKLKHIDLTRSFFKSKSVDALLIAAPNMDYLNIYASNDITINSAQNLYNLPFLKRITISSVDLTNNLRVLFKAAPNIKEVSIKTVEDMAFSAPSAFEKYEKIELLDLSEEEVTSDTLELLLNSFPNIKRLNITSANISGGRIDLEENFLPQLALIEVSGCNISKSCLQQILAAAPKLDREFYKQCGYSDSDDDDLEQGQVKDSPIVRSATAPRNLDANTALDPNNVYNIKQIFYPLHHQKVPQVRDYRLDVYQTINVNPAPCNLPQAFSLVKSGDLNLMKPVALKKTGVKPEITPAGRQLYHGKQSIHLTKDWQPLASLSAQEEMVQYQVYPETVVEIQYSTRDHLYYIRNTSADALDLSIEMTLSVPEEKEVQYPPALQAFIQQFRDYTAGALELSNKPLSGKDYLLAMVTQKKGACRHRTFAFKNEMQKQFPNTPVRIVDNDCHAFVELFIEGAWSRCDLGGYPAKVNVINPDSPKPVAKVNQKVEPFNAKSYKRVISEKTPLAETLIDKLCAFLNHTKRIPQSRELKERGDLSNAFSYAQMHTSPVEWDKKLIQPIIQWDGLQGTLTTELSQQLEALHHSILSYKVVNGQRFYLGSKLKLFLNMFNEPCTLFNHVIGVNIKPGMTKGSWLLWGAFGSRIKVVNQEQLHQVLIEKLGPLIAIETSTDVSRMIKDAPYINDLDTFIGEGGLLLLIRSSNKELIISELKKRSSIQCTPKALEGLFLRDIDDKPAWVKGLECKATARLTYELLMQFVSMNQETFESVLLNSLEHLGKDVRDRFITSFKENLRKEPNPNAAHKKLYALFRRSDYEQHFKPREKKHELVGEQNWKTYCQGILNAAGSIKKQLIEVQSDESLKGLRFGLERVAQSTSRPIYYIHEADDLICMAPFITRANNNTGTLKKGPGGRLYDFLNTNRDKAPILVVNYANFRAEEIVRFNELLDKERRVNGLSLPQKTQILGLINVQKEGCYQGSDFYSRFDAIKHCTLENNELQQAIINPIVVDKTAQTPGNIPVINLFHAADWKARLLGRWVLNGHSLTYEAGALPALLSQTNTIEIQNGLWGSEAFHSFWQEAVLRGAIVHEGVSYKLPAGFNLIKSDGYAWPELKKNLRIMNEMSGQEEVLNPTCLSQFFSHYQYSDAHKSLEPAKGFIERAKAQKTLSIYITRNIKDDDWARLLHECKQQGVTLNARLAPGVSIPEKLKDIKSPYLAAMPTPLALVSAPLQSKPVWPAKDLNAPLTVIESSDVDVTVGGFTKDKSKEFHVIDVSECQPEDLLQRIQGALNPETLRFEFNQLSGVLSDALKTAKNIILKGRFSAELADKLASILLGRLHNKTIKGQWILVSDKPDVFSYLPSVHRHVVTAAEKAEVLQLTPTESTKITSALLNNESLSQLQARQRFLKAGLGLNSDDAWKGMRDVPVPKNTWAPLGSNTAKDAAEWTLNRLKAVQAQLQNHPYVFLSGLSGVGKSTFVTKVLSKTCTLYLGEQQMLSWAKDKTQGPKILFIDEANLSAREWSEFEGLFQNPPRILIGGQLHDLSPLHKVVFAGNPTSYGDERHLAPLFKRHGGALLFEPLPAASLYEEVLKPVFAGNMKPDKALAACSHFLSLYGFFVGHSTTDVLISPRELQMMALLTMSYAQKHPHANVLAVAKHYAYQVTKHLVPKEIITEFEHTFKAPSVIVPMAGTQEQGFVVTESRQEAYQQLGDFLSLAQWRVDNPNLNEAQKYGGLGGIILEGEPGMGKSELVMHILIKHGFQEAHAQKPLPKIPFYKLPVSLSNTEKEALLRKAFDEGAVVLIDEINSAPMMERLLNDLLMGTTPERQRPKKPGFMVIGTQNPVTMAGRRAPSTALSRRMTTIVLPDYTEAEMREILQAQSIPALEIEPMISAFIKCKISAQNNFLSTVPSFRDLATRAKNLLTAQNATPVVVSAQTLSFTAPSIGSQPASLYAGAYQSLAAATNTTS